MRIRSSSLPGPTRARAGDAAAGQRFLSAHADSSVRPSPRPLAPVSAPSIYRRSNTNGDGGERPPGALPSRDAGARLAANTDRVPMSFSFSAPLRARDVSEVSVLPLLRVRGPPRYVLESRRSSGGSPRKSTGCRSFVELKVRGASAWFHVWYESPSSAGGNDRRACWCTPRCPTSCNLLDARGVEVDFRRAASARSSPTPASPRR
jgi:hypothetical protein